MLILVLFMLMGREDLSDRIVGLFGHRQVSLTTRTMEEIGQRISRYLATFALVNSGFGLVIGLGLGLIGVPYAVLWGCLAAMLRFIPYVGPAVAFVLPLVFSFAHFPGWAQPLEVVALFGVVEVVLNSFLEPVIYGKTTGVSALGLLVAAMFWTWLWGTLGLLLSTPLTVCLAVLGKYVPSLRFFATLLGEEAELEPDVRFYQRLVALDRDGAIEVVEAAAEAAAARRGLRSGPGAGPVAGRARCGAGRAGRGGAGLRLAGRRRGPRRPGRDAGFRPGVPEPLDRRGTRIGCGGVAARVPVTLVGLAVQDTADALVLADAGAAPGPVGLHPGDRHGHRVAACRSPSGWPSSPPSSSSCRTCRRRG